MKFHPFLMGSALLLLAGCSASLPAETTEQTEPVETQIIQKSFTEQIAALDPDAADAFKNFQADAIESVEYWQDEWDSIIVTDPETIDKLVEALQQVQISGPYTEDIMVTDSASGLVFTMKSGDLIRITFDFGHLDLQGTLYNLENTKDLDRLLNDLSE